MPEMGGRTESMVSQDFDKIFVRVNSGTPMILEVELIFIPR